MKNKSSNTNSSARWDLFPYWIRVCTTFYFLFALFAVLSSIYSLLTDGVFLADIYQLRKTRIENIGELSFILIFIKLLVAYGYIFQKDWAIRVGITDAILGIFICVMVMIYTTSIYEMLFFQIIILAIYLRKIKSIKTDWENIQM